MKSPRHATGPHKGLTGWGVHMGRTSSAGWRKEGRNKPAGRPHAAPPPIGRPLSLAGARGAFFLLPPPPRFWRRRCRSTSFSSSAAPSLFSAASSCATRGSSALTAASGRPKCDSARPRTSRAGGCVGSYGSANRASRPAARTCPLRSRHWAIMPHDDALSSSTSRRQGAVAGGLLQEVERIGGRRHRLLPLAVRFGVLLRLVQEGIDAGGELAHAGSLRALLLAPHPFELLLRQRLQPLFPRRLQLRHQGLQHAQGRVMAPQARFGHAQGDAGRTMHGVVSEGRLGLVLRCVRAPQLEQAVGDQAVRCGLEPPAAGAVAGAPLQQVQHRAERRHRLRPLVARVVLLQRLGHDGADLGHQAGRRAMLRLLRAALAAGCWGGHRLLLAATGPARVTRLGLLLAHGWPVSPCVCVRWLVGGCVWSLVDRYTRKQHA